MILHILFVPYKISILKLVTIDLILNYGNHTQ